MSDSPKAISTVKTVEKKNMFKSINKEEMMEMLKKAQSDGLIKEVGLDYFSLTNKGYGKLVEYLYDFVDIMREVESYKNHSKEYLLQITTESLMQTFGSKLQALIILNGTEWKSDLKRQLEMPMDELLKEMGLEVEMPKQDKKAKEEIKPVTDGSNVISLSKKKNETIH